VAVCTLGFLIVLLLGSALFACLPCGWPRRIALALANGGLLAILRPDARSVAALALFVLSGYGAARLLRARPSRGLCLAYLALLVAAFVVLNRYVFLLLFLPVGVFEHAIRIVGLSYMLFRQVHFVVDAMGGRIERVSLWGYLNYQLNLFTLLAGPIQRYQAFEAYWRDPRPSLATRSDLLLAYARIFLGALKVWVVAAVCLGAYERMLAYFSAAPVAPNWSASLRFLALVYLYPAYVYFNFSGYCDVVIGGAALIGLELPENFDRPYLARNMLDFWRRWHRTLSFWARDYLFTPLYKAPAQRWPRRAPLWGAISYLVTLLIIGTWHGSTENFICFGLLHGVGVVVAKFWEDFLLRRRGRAGLNAYLRSPRIRAIAVFLTFHFACASFLLFPENLSRTMAALSKYFSILKASLGA